MKLRGDNFKTRPGADMETPYESVVRDGVTWGLSATPEVALPDLPVESPPGGRRSPSAVTFPRQMTWWGLFCRPWSRRWKWVLLVGCVAGALLYWLSQASSSIVVSLVQSLVLSVTVPAAMLCLFVEWDVTRRVAVSEALLTALAGVGMASVAALLNAAFGISEKNAMWAAVVEEPCKGLVLLVLASRARRFPGILSGLALGCAVGAGFAVIETIGYGYAYGTETAPSIDVFVLRGLLSPFMHAAWTGALGGALWAARGINGSLWRMFRSPFGWLVLGGMMLCHAAWNATWLWSVLCLVSWTVLFHYVGRGIKQAFEENLVAKEFS